MKLNMMQRAHTLVLYNTLQMQLSFDSTRSQSELCSQDTVCKSFSTYEIEFRDNRQGSIRQHM